MHLQCYVGWYWELALQVDTAEFDGAFEIPACAPETRMSSWVPFFLGRIWSPLVGFLF